MTAQFYEWILVAPSLLCTAVHRARTHPQKPFWKGNSSLKHHSATTKSMRDCLIYCGCYMKIRLHTHTHNIWIIFEWHLCSSCSVTLFLISLWRVGGVGGGKERGWMIKASLWCQSCIKFALQWLSWAAVMFWSAENRYLSFDALTRWYYTTS